MTRLRMTKHLDEWMECRRIYSVEIDKINAKLGVKPLKLPASHDEFAGHLLDVHEHWCRACVPGLADGRFVKVTTSVQTEPVTEKPTTATPKESDVQVPGDQGMLQDEPIIPQTQRAGRPWPVDASTPKSTVKSRGVLFSPIHPTIVMRQVRAQEGLPPLPDSDDSDDSEDGQDADEDDILPDNPSAPTEDLYNMSLDSMVFQVQRDTPAEDEEEAEEEAEEEVEEEVSNDDPGKEAKSLIQGEKCIVYVSIILQLLQLVYGLVCKKSGCVRDLLYTVHGRGTAVLVKWQCSGGHAGGKWWSQPKFKGVYAGNLHMASALIMSGNNFSKIHLMAKFFKLHFFSESTFYRYQRLFIAPAVAKYWSDMQRDLIHDLQGTSVIIAGDGRNDSPGHSAQYCTYSFLDASSGRILHVEVVDVREAAGKSTNMERIGFERGMSFLAGKVNVKTMVTDAHPQIMAVMKRCEKYEGIGHQIDVWHGGKNLAKRLVKAASDKSCKPLMPWVPAIKNHFWYVSKSCGGDADTLSVSLASILHHVCNEHEWELQADGSPGICNHGPLAEDAERKPWLEKGSASHRALERVLSDTRFRNTLPYYADFLHTGKLESFHSHLLMYCSKRHAFKYIGYSTRNLLAAIDHNSHLDRPAAITKSGEVVKAKAFNKRAKRFLPTVVPVDKEYLYIDSLVEMVFMERAARPGSMNVVVPMSADDPRRIFPNRYMVLAPSMEQLVQEHVSRFN